MTDLMDAAEKQEQVSETFTTAGKRWKQMAVSTVQRKIPKQRWLRFAAQVQGRYTSARDRFKAIERRVRAETPPSPEPDRGSPAEIAERLIAEAESPLNELPPNVERSSHFMLEGRLKAFLAGLLDIHIPAVKIYANQAADALTRKQGADALTYRDKILFRGGKYNPRDAAGIALLGHELTHAAQVKIESQNMPGYVTNTNLENQERQALANESKVWQHVSSPVPLSPGLNFGRTHHGGQPPFHHSVKSSGPAVSQPARGEPGSHQLHQTQAAQPKAALSSRQVSLPPETSAALSGPAELSEQQLNQIKEVVYRDLMDRIRIEFERGG